jgi:hypothetical protein
MALTEQMQRAMGVKTAIASYGSQVPTQKYTFRSPKWARDAYRKATSGLGWHTQCTTLPKHNSGTTASSSITPNTGAPQQDTLHLMSSVHRTRDHTVLLQDNLETIKNDRTLFLHLKTRLSRRRNPLLLALSCRSIEGIFFTKVSLRKITFVYPGQVSNRISSAYGYVMAWKCAITTHVASP